MMRRKAAAQTVTQRRPKISCTPSEPGWKRRISLSPLYNMRENFPKTDIEFSLLGTVLGRGRGRITSFFPSSVRI